MPVDLGNYLRQKGSPLAGHMNELYAAANKYRIDPRLIVAIAGGETSFGTQGQGPKNFNAWGIGPGITYNSWAEGLNAAAKLLRSGYVGQGLTSLAKIQQKWAPIAATNDPTNLNSNWLRNMSRLYADLGGNPNNVTAGWRKAASPTGKQRNAPQPTPSVQPQTGQPATSMMKVPTPGVDFLQQQMVDLGSLAGENLADIAAGKSALPGLTRLAGAVTSNTEIQTMIDATEAAAAAARQNAPDGKQSSTKSPDGGTYTTTPTRETANTGGATDERVMKAIQIAKKQIGYPYIYGAESRKERGFDCSGLIDFAFRQAGIDLPVPRLTTYNAIKLGKSIREGAMQPGDWLITNKGNHMVMYIGGGQVIAAPHSGTKVQLQPVSRFKGDIVDVRRVR